MLDMNGAPDRDVPLLWPVVVVDQKELGRCSSHPDLKTVVSPEKQNRAAMTIRE